MGIKQNTFACSEREFGFSLVKWEIKNYFAATCQENWIIYSPNFVVKGKVCTKWRLSLNVIYKFEKYCVMIYLERLECDIFTDVVRVSWKLSYPFETSKLKFEGDSDFENGKIVGIELCDLDLLDEILQTKDNDTVVIKCLMLVYPKDSNVYGRPKDMGLKSLSQDLRVLYRVDKNYDMKIHIDGLPAKVHKAVLWSRNKVLRAAIEESDFIDLTDLDFAATKDVLGYLYTGNLDYVLRKPSFNILDCIKCLQVKELEGYYKCDKLTLFTRNDVKEYTFDWGITNINSLGVAYIQSPLFIAEELHVTFRLYVYPKRFMKKSDNVLVFFEVVEGSLLQSSYIEFVVSDSACKCLFIQRMRMSMITDADIGFEIFFPRHILEDICLAKDEKLIISCTIRSFVGSDNILTTESKTDTKILINYEQHYDLLSDQIASLFETGMYSDFTMTCEGGCFKIHSYILSARSHFFRTAFKKIKCLGRKTFYVPSIQNHVLKALLFHIYSGKLLDHEIADVLKIYKASEMFSLLPLKYSCSSILQNNINVQNICNVLELANTHKDHKLKSAVLKLLSAIPTEYLSEIANLHIVDDCKGINM